MEEKIRKHILGKAHYRTNQVRAENIDAEKRVIPMSFSSQTPVVRWWGIEVLSHKPECIRMGRATAGLPFLDSHDSSRQGGRIENYKPLEGGRTGGDVRFAKTDVGNELWSLHSDNIRMETSMGYIIHHMTEMTPEEMPDEMKELALREKVPVLNIDDWEPIEGSSVSMPADPSVGQGRSLEYYDDLRAYAMIAEGRSLELQTLIPADIEVGAGQNHNQPINIGVRTMEQGKETKAPADTTQPTREEILKADAQRREKIETWGKKFVGRVEGIDAMIHEACANSEMPFELFKGMVAERVADSKPIETPEGALGLSDGEAKEFSISRLIHGAALHASGDANAWKGAEFERDCSVEVAKTLDMGGAPGIRGTNPKAIRVFIPWEIMQRDIKVTREMMQFGKRHNLMQRTLSIGSATAGGNLKATELLASQFIDLPRNETLLERLGARVMTGLVGDYTFPKQTGASTFGWVTTEGNAPSTGDPTFGTVSLSPKIGGAYVDYTYKLMLQASPAIDGLVQADLLQVADLAIDLAGYHGTAANGQPRGIVNQSGVGTVDGAGLGLEAIIEFITDVMGANLLGGRLAWATNPTIWGYTQVRERWLSTGKPLAETGQTMNGYPLAVSNQIASGHLFFGDHSQVIVGNWGGYSLLVDPYTASSAGTTRVRILVAVDIAMRLAAAFSVATAVD